MQSQITRLVDSHLQHASYGLESELHSMKLCIGVRSLGVTQNHRRGNACAKTSLSTRLQTTGDPLPAHLVDELAGLRVRPGAVEDLRQRTSRHSYQEKRTIDDSGRVKRRTHAHSVNRDDSSDKTCLFLLLLPLLDSACFNRYKRNTFRNPDQGTERGVCSAVTF